LTFKIFTFITFLFFTD